MSAVWLLTGVKRTKLERVKIDAYDPELPSGDELCCKAATSGTPGGHPYPCGADAPSQIRLMPLPQPAL